MLRFDTGINYSSVLFVYVFVCMCVCAFVNLATQSMVWEGETRTGGIVDPNHKYHWHD